MNDFFFNFLAKIFYGTFRIRNLRKEKPEHFKLNGNFVFFLSLFFLLKIINLMHGGTFFLRFLSKLFLQNFFFAILDFPKFGNFSLKFGVNISWELFFGITLETGKYSRWRISIPEMVTKMVKNIKIKFFMFFFC